MTCPKCHHCRSILATKKRAGFLAKPLSRKSIKLQKAKAHQMSTKEIRADCVERSHGWCELHCGEFVVAADMHHLEGGSGRRRQKQAVSNCVMLCRADHIAYHRSPRDFDARVIAHCNKYGYPVPRFVEHQPLPSKRV